MARKWLLLLSFLVISLIAKVSGQIEGEWLSDWQNIYLNTKYSACSDFPSSLVITQLNSSFISVDFNTINSSLACAAQRVQEFQLAQPNTWTNLSTDSSQLSIIYDSSTNTILYNNTNIAALYSRNGSILSAPETVGPLFGTWSNPSPTSPSLNQMICCAPQSFFLMPLSSFQFGSRIKMNFDLGYISCPNPDSLKYALREVNATALTWTSLETDAYPVESSDTASDSEKFAHLLDYQMSFTYGASLDQLIVTIGQTGSCQYIYRKSRPTQLLNNIWFEDWQSVSTGLGPLITQYEISTVSTENNFYMLSTWTLTNQTINSYAVEYSPNVYLDPYLYVKEDQIPFYFTYDPNTQTLFDSVKQLLFTLNGSLFSSVPFVGTWVPQDTNNNDNCCVPTSIIISQDPTLQNTLDIIYNIPPDIVNSSICLNYTYWVDWNTTETQITSLLQVLSPNITQLTWVDDMTGNLISFITPSSLSQLNLTTGDNQCGMFILIREEPIQPKASSFLAVYTGIIYVIIVVLTY